MSVFTPDSRVMFTNGTMLKLDCKRISRHPLEGYMGQHVGSRASSSVLCRERHLSLLGAIMARDRQLVRSTRQNSANERLDLSSESQVLDKFWQSRGIVDDADRRRLVDLSLDKMKENEEMERQGAGRTEEFFQTLPGVSSTWDASGKASEEQVTFFSRKILELYRFLGSRPDVDVVWMVQREPKLLQSSTEELTARLLELRIDAAAQNIDIAKLAESQPSLLLEPNVAGNDEFSEEKKLAAWQHGLMSDGAREWNKSYDEMVAYEKKHGDSHVGYRDGDARRLYRWCKKQRNEYKAGILEAAKVEKLEQIGFEFDEETAEWMRWYNELLYFNETYGHSNPVPLGAPKGTTLYERMFRMRKRTCMLY